MKMKSSLSLKNFFFPLGGCLIAALILNNCTQNLPETLFFSFEKSHPELMQWIKVWGRLGFSSLATVFLILLSLRVEVQKIIRWFFIGATSAIYLYFFYLIPHFLQGLNLEAPPSQDQSLSYLILKNWIPISFYLLSSYWPGTVILFIYSFANRYLKLTETFATYPIFAILGIIIPILFTSRQASPLTFSLEALQQTGLFTIILSLCCFSLFEWIHLKNSPCQDKEGEKGTLFDKSKLFMQGMLVLATAHLYQLNKSVWFSKGAVEYPAPQEYTHFLTSFEGLRSLGMLLDVVFLLFVLIALENRSGKAWKNIYTGIIVVSVSIGLSLIFYNAISNDLFGQILLKEDSTLQSFFEGVAIGSGYQIFFTAVSYPILLCLKEMSFQIYPPKKRFTAKLFVDLVFAKAGLLLAALASLFGSGMPILLRLFLFTAVLLFGGILWFYLAFKVGNEIEELSLEETENSFEEEALASTHD